MERRRRFPGAVETRSHGQGAAGLLAALLLLAPALPADETSVFRCTDPDGAVELSQFPCPEGTEERELRVEDRKTGWAPPRVESQARRKAPKEGSRNRKAPAKNDMAAARRADQCWSKRRQLEEVNWKLRRGYRPVEGVKLRRRRQSYEDYIGRYCAGN